MFTKVLKWILFAVGAVLVGVFVRRTYLDSIPSTNDLETGVDVYNAASRSAAKHGIQEGKLFVAFENSEGKLRIGDDRTAARLEQLNNVIEMPKAS
jgi:hypothetical protein